MLVPVKPRVQSYPQILDLVQLLSSLPCGIRVPKPSSSLLLVNVTMAILWGLIFRPSFYSPLSYHIQGFLHNLSDSVCKFTLDYDDDVVSIAEGAKA